MVFITLATQLRHHVCPRLWRDACNSETCYVKLPPTETMEE